MKKERQKLLQKWLREQQKTVKKYLLLNVFFGAISALFMMGQMALIALMLHKIIIEHQTASQFIAEIGLLFGSFTARAVLIWLREQMGFKAGKTLRLHLRQQIIQKLLAVGPMSLQQKPTGSWANLMLEQVENLHNFYARYLPQQFLSLIVPILILCVVFPINWAAGLILFSTLPLLPIFMALAGIKAVEANQRNIGVLSRMSGQFLDKLRGLETIRLFGQAEKQTEQIYQSTEEFRLSTMDVLKMAFLSSAVLEFFTAISIAGFFCLMLAPEFYQPLRELGVFYHDKAAAIAAADNIETFLNEEVLSHQVSQKDFQNQPLVIQAKDCVVLSVQGKCLTQPLNFEICEKQHIALVGQSGAGKSSLMNMLLGFLPYEGSVTINGVELRELNLSQWRAKLAWVGQNPQLIRGSLKENILLGNREVSEQSLEQALSRSKADEFVYRLGLEHQVQDSNAGISGGQAQRIAIARALLRDYELLMLDEPTASLDLQSEQQVLEALQHLSQQHTTLMITHRVEDLANCDEIWVMKKGEIIQKGKFAEIKSQGDFAELLN